jgi:hypothetical protein
MYFAIAAGLLAQTLPIALAAERNSKVRHLTCVAHKKRIHDLIQKLSGDNVQNNNQQSIVVTPNFLEKKLS